MIEINNTIISRDVLENHFACDLSVCKGACCVMGDSGAPLEEEEVDILHSIFKDIKPFLRQEGIEAIENLGTSVVDFDGDRVTPLVDGKECAYVIFEKGIARCGIERAFMEGATNFRKPLSCHLYPVRITRYRTFDAVNYDRWDICKAAITKGEENRVTVYDFTGEALTRKYGGEWFSLLKAAAERLSSTNEQ